VDKREAMLWSWCLAVVVASYSNLPVGVKVHGVVVAANDAKAYSPRLKPAHGYGFFCLPVPDARVAVFFFIKFCSG